MGKIKIKIVSAIILLIFCLELKAQITDTVVYIAADSLMIEPEDLSDSLIFENETMPDENLDDIFNEKLSGLKTNWYAKEILIGDTSEVKFIDYYPTNLPDSVYITRLQDIEQIVDLSYNKVVRNFIILYTEKRRELTNLIIGLSDYYFPIFEEALDKNDLPMELKYLPIIESALNPKARSRAGANGLWQFMYGTGKQMKLEISSFVDERRDPLKSTEAAMKYLKLLFDQYGDWHLAIAAYNCGPGNVNRAIRRSGGKTNYWEIYYRLPRETRGYVPAYIAACYFMNYYREHNLIPQVPEIPLLTDTIMVSDYLHFEQIAGNLSIDIEELQALNPMYRTDVIPAKNTKPYPLVLPEEKIMEFIDKDTSIFAYDRDKFFPNNTLQNPTDNSYFTPADIKGKTKIIYTVKSGDNVGFISSWFNVRASDLRYWNNINRNLIRVGQKLAVFVPEKQKDKYEKVNTMSFVQKQALIGKSAAPSQKSKPVSIDPNYEYYTVKSGDTIWEISQKYTGISSDEILRLNNLNSGRSLYIGQKLKIKRKS